MAASGRHSSNRTTAPASDRRLRSTRSSPEPIELSSLSEASSPETNPLPMPDTNEASGSNPQNAGTAPQVESHDQPPSGTSDMTVPVAPTDANTAGLILAALLKVAKGQDVLLQHIQTTQASPPTQPPPGSAPTLRVQPLQPSLAPPPLPTPPSHSPPGIQPSFLVPEQPQTTMAIPPPFPAGGFMPPASNTGHGAYSLQSLFPDIEESLLLAIGRHMLRPGQISKLDNRLRDKHVASNLEYENGILVHKEKPPSSKDFPTFESLHYPLQRYFSVLQAQVVTACPPPVLIPFIIGCNDYISLLNVMHLDYEWTAVLNYHFAVHALRLSEMAQGNFSLWGRIDTECQNRYLVGHARSRYNKDRSAHKGTGDIAKNQTCNDFNFRTCYREKCQRIHKCRGCDSSDHGVSKCPKKSS
jgi:hypothetical protein